MAEIDGLEFRLFPNDYKKKDNAPDMVGVIKGDIDYKVSCWVNEFKGKEGSYLTVRIVKKLSKEKVEEKNEEGNIKDLPF
jgi:hypothetical protein